MRRDSEHFGEADLDLLYIAKRLRDALKIEQLLTAAKIDYMIETDTYRGGVIFVGERVGVFFYVLPERLEAAQELLRRERFKPYDGPR
ncbi:MAG TPA: hypothetical protein VE621_08000 [Bryobacteraceae bacterium]|nr:hypothetical protein [Bryobacteraceae bacterium]